MNNLDVHHLTLNEAITVIGKQIETAYSNNIPVLYVNHGFNRGNRIKTWCKNEGKNLNHVIKVEPGDNEGITKFFIEINIKNY